MTDEIDIDHLHGQAHFLVFCPQTKIKLFLEWPFLLNFSFFTTQPTNHFQITYNLGLFLQFYWSKNFKLLKTPPLLYIYGSQSISWFWVYGMLSISILLIYWITYGCYIVQIFSIFVIVWLYLSCISPQSLLSAFNVGLL
jgi:hypothetical protein